MAVYLIIGAAIGSVTPNILASLTTNRNGKRTAVLNLLFNLIRAGIILALITAVPAFLTWIQNLTPNSISHQVANTHTIFAILAVLIEFPFAGKICALSEKIIPLLPSESKKIEDRKLMYMVQAGDLPSSLALYHARLEISRQGKIARDSLEDALNSFFSGDDDLAAGVIETETTVDILTDKIMEKLIALRSMDYTPRELSQVSQMMLAASDIERISDYAENIAEYEGQIKARKGALSQAGREDLQNLATLTLQSIDCALEVFEQDQMDRIPESEALEQRVDDLYDRVVASHIRRLMKGECNPVSGVFFTNIASALERCSDHAINVAGALEESPVN